MKRAAGMVLYIFSCAGAAQTDTGGTAVDCAEGSPRLMITDDPYNTPSEVAEKWRETRLPTPYAQARRQVARLSCVNTVDPDPLLLALPGAPLPDLIVRIRPARVELYDRTLGDKLDAGVRGYIESYTTWLGARSTTDGPPLLRTLALSVSVICTRDRRTIRELTALDDEPTQALVQNGENTAMAQNTERIERATRRIVAAIENLARNLKSVCGAPFTPGVRPASPGGISSTPADTAMPSPAPRPASPTPSFEAPSR